MKRLFIGAHHDDMEIGAGALMIDSDPGSLLLVLFPREDKGSRDEQESAAEHLGIRWAWLNGDGFKDRDIVSMIEAILPQGAGQIVTVSPYDSHPEHRRVADIAKQVGRRNQIEVLYSEPNAPFGRYTPEAPRPNTFYPFTVDTRLRKLKALQEYEVLADELDAVGRRDYHYGAVIGRLYAETFWTDWRIIDA